MNFDKKIKGGLKKCPLHKFGADYEHIKEGWFECHKCHAFRNVLDEIKEMPTNTVKINVFKLGVSYEFK